MAASLIELISVFSLNALADLITPVTNAVQYFGACYLFYLGYSQWTAGKFSMDNEVSAQSHLRELLTGFLLAGTNPKVMIFYLSVLPSLIDLNQVSLAYGLKIVATVAISLLRHLHHESLRALQYRHRPRRILRH